MNRNSALRVARGRARALLRRLHHEEDGQTLLLRVGLICIVLVLLFVAASTAVVYLDLKTLTSLTDLAAAAGTDDVEAYSYYGGGVTNSVPGSLTGVGVGSKAAEDLSTQPAATRLERVTIASARAVDSHTVEMRLQARSRPPFPPREVLPAEDFTVTATGSARMTTTQ